MNIIWNASDPEILFGLLSGFTFIFKIGLAFVVAGLLYLVISFIYSFFLIKDKQKKTVYTNNILVFTIFAFLMLPGFAVTNGEPIYVFTPRAYQFFVFDALEDAEKERIKKIYTTEEMKMILKKEYKQIDEFPVLGLFFFAFCGSFENVVKNFVDATFNIVSTTSRGFLGITSEVIIKQFYDKIKDKDLKTDMENFYRKIYDRVYDVLSSYYDDIVFSTESSQNVEKVNSEKYSPVVLLSEILKEKSVIDFYIDMVALFNNQIVSDKKRKELEDFYQREGTVFNDLYRYISEKVNKEKGTIESDAIENSFTAYFIRDIYILIPEKNSINFVSLKRLENFYKDQNNTPSKNDKITVAKYYDSLKERLLQHIANEAQKQGRALSAIAEALELKVDSDDAIINNAEARDFLVAAYFSSVEGDELMRLNSTSYELAEKGSIVQGLAATIEANKFSVLSSKIITGSIIDILSIFIIVLGPYVAAFGAFFAPRSGIKILRQIGGLVLGVILIRPLTYFIEGLIGSFINNITLAKQTSSLFGVSSLYTEAVLGETLALNYVFILIYLILIYFLISNFKGANILGDMMGRFIPTSDQEMVNALSGNYNFDGVSVGNISINNTNVGNMSVGSRTIRGYDGYAKDGFTKYVAELEKSAEKGDQNAQVMLETFKSHGWVSYYDTGKKDTAEKNYYVTDDNFTRMMVDANFSSNLQNLLALSNPDDWKNALENYIKTQEMAEKNLYENIKEKGARWQADYYVVKSVLESYGAQGEVSIRVSGSAQGSMPGASAGSSQEVLMQKDISSEIADNLKAMARERFHENLTADEIKEALMKTVPSCQADPALAEKMAYDIYKMRNSNYYEDLKNNFEKMTAQPNSAQKNK